MLSYQHGYHAGCFADVIKHITLSRLLHYMINKDKPLFYLETHSGRGRYDLQNPQALKTGEAQLGIEPFWKERKQFNALFTPYIEAIDALNENHALRHYPGSPELAIQMLRKQDRLFFSELHPGEFEHLNQLSKRGKRVFFSESDGIEQLSALLPPLERRGLIFIDPAYEIKEEYRTIPKMLKAAVQRFSSGVYCLWYPLVDNKLHSQLIRGLTSIPGSHLQVEFYLTKTVQASMYGCGLWIINPPYVLSDELKSILPALCKTFNPGISSFTIDKHNL